MLFQVLHVQSAKDTLAPTFFQSKKNQFWHYNLELTLQTSSWKAYFILLTCVERRDICPGIDPKTSSGPEITAKVYKLTHENVGFVVLCYPVQVCHYGSHTTGIVIIPSSRSAYNCITKCGGYGCRHNELKAVFLNMLQSYKYSCIRPIL